MLRDLALVHGRGETRGMEDGLNLKSIIAFADRFQTAAVRSKEKSCALDE